MITVESRRSAALGLCVAAWLFAALGLMPWLNAAGLSVFACGIYAYLTAEHYRRLNNLLWLPVLIVGFLIAIYRPDGFNYPLIASAPALHPGGVPFQLHLNTAKALAGWLVVVLLIGHHTSRSRPRRPQPIPSPLSNRSEQPIGPSLLYALLAAVLVLGAAKLLLDLAWTPKWSLYVIPFVLVNLFATVVAEEAFFRLLMQRHMEVQLLACRSSWCCSPWLSSVAPVLSTGLLFALAHRAAWDGLFLVYLIAGFAYATVYAVTQRFSVAVGTHFTVNFCHFLFLPYPLA